MITFEDLKQIEASPFYDTFKSKIDRLKSDLFILLSDPNMNKNRESNNISEEDMSVMEYYRTDLFKLIYAQTDEEKAQALTNLKKFPTFLSQPAFSDQANSPSILERMCEVAAVNSMIGPKLQTHLEDVVKCLELDLSEDLTVGKLGSDRQIWTQPIKASIPKLPKREEAAPGTWAALFYKLTKQSNKPNTCKDVSVYEHKCSDNSFRRLAAMNRLLQNKGDEEATKYQLDTDAAELRKNPLSAMTLRNEHTVEMLRRGDIAGVATRISDTKTAFSFNSFKEIGAAKSRAGFILKKMNGMKGKAASSPEFTALKNVMKKFAETDYKDKSVAAKDSASVLMAVENFTKGRKNVQRSERAQECVNLALDALVSVVPNAATNPHVTPLIKRFNQVRSSRKQISLSEFGTARNYTEEKAVADIRQSFVLQQKDEELVEAAAKSTASLHGGKIEPIAFKNTIKTLLWNRYELPELTKALTGDNDSYKKASMSLIEDMAADEKLVNEYKSMTIQEMKSKLQARSEELSQKQMIQPIQN